MIVSKPAELFLRNLGLTGDVVDFFRELEMEELTVLLSEIECTHVEPDVPISDIMTRSAQKADVLEKSFLAGGFYQPDSSQPELVIVPRAPFLYLVYHLGQRAIT